MKIGILTFIGTINYGAVLQAYALQEVIKSFGYDAEIIQYTNLDITNKERNIRKNAITLKGILKKIIIRDGFKKKEIAFDMFENKYISKGLILNNNTIDCINNEYDFFVTGSDQVWNMDIIHEDWTYFLDFVKEDKKKISYAPSFGNSVFPESSYDKARQLLDKIHFLSVREASGADLIKQLLGRNSRVVLDPTLLLTREEWERMIEYKPPMEHYILVYFPHNKKIVFDFVKKLKKTKQIPVVYLSISPRVQVGVKTIYDASPEEFLGWIKHADYIVTGSFHGTAFSINLEKQFFYEPSGEGSRIDNLVTMTGTKDRCISCENVENRNIDYRVVSEKLIESREESIYWLKNSFISNDEGKNEK